MKVRICAWNYKRHTYQKVGDFELTSMDFPCGDNEDLDRWTVFVDAVNISNKITNGEFEVRRVEKEPQPPASGLTAKQHL